MILRLILEKFIDYICGNSTYFEAERGYLRGLMEDFIEKNKD